MGRTTERRPLPTILDRLGRTPLAYFVLSALAVIIFAKTTGFTIDKFDEDLILKANINYLVKEATLVDVLQRDAFFRNPGKIFYRPVQNLSFFIDAQNGDGKPAAFYVTSILLHALASCLLFALLKRFLGRSDISIAGAMLFAANPLFCQAIAWIPGRGDLLLAVFSMLTMLSMHSYMRSGSARSLILFAAATVLAMFSKETAAVLLVLIPMSWLLLFDRNAHTWKRLGILTGITAAATALLLWMRAIINTDPPTYNSFELVNVVENLRVFPEIVAKLFVPSLLQPMAGYTMTASVLGAIIALTLVATAIASGLPRARNLTLFGLAWYVLFMLPGSLYTHRFGSMAYDYLEHRGYASVIGLMILIGAATALALKRFPSTYVATAIVAAVLGYGVAAYAYTDNYETSLAFYNRVVEHNPGSALARTNRGQILQFEGNAKAAMEDYKVVANAFPDFVVNRIVMGGLYMNGKDFDNAIIHFKHALKIDSSITQPYMFLGHAYNGKANADSALKYYEKALDADQNSYDAALNVGVIASQRGSWDKALTMFTRCIMINPSSAVAWQFKGVANQQLGRLSAACADWERGASLGDAQSANLRQQYCGSPSGAGK